MGPRPRLPTISARAVSRALDSVVPYGVAVLLLLGLERTPIVENLNLLQYDLVTSMRPAPSGGQTPITILGIDENDISRFGWPIDDRLLCRGIDRLLAGGVRAIGIDLYRDQGVGPEQDCLRERVRDNPGVVSILNVAEDIGPIPGTPPGQQAFNDLVVDPDGVVRRDLIHVAGQDEAIVSLPMRLLALGTAHQGLLREFERGTPPGPFLEGTSGGYTAIDAAGYQTMLAFHQLGSFATTNLSEVLADRPPPRELLDGRIVLIGSTAPSLRDLFPVPQTRLVQGERQLLIPGVEIHAHRLAALVAWAEGDHSLRIRTLPRWGERLLEVSALLAGIGLGEAFVLMRRSVMGVGLLAAMLLSGSTLLLSEHIWIGPAMPLASLVAMASAGWIRRGGSGQQQRRQFERLLGQSTSPQVARQLWNQRDDLLSNGRFQGQLLPVTVLFMDICDFTSVSEQLNPQDLLDWLNQGLAAFIPEITRRGGMVNKFTGDGLLAIFGAPLSQSRSADCRAALEASLAIQQVVISLNRDLERDGSPRMQLRVGLHSGPVLAGSLGSSERLEYGVIGDTVNCASRLESLEKHRQDNLCRVLTSADTHRLIPREVAQGLEWNYWGEKEVKGRQHPLEIWELRGSITEDSEPADAQASRH